MSEVIIRTVSRHIDPASKHYMHDWTAGDVVCIAPNGTFIDKDGSVKHQQQNKTSLIIRVDADLPRDFAGGATVNPDCTYLTKYTQPYLLSRSNRIVNLSALVDKTALMDLYNKEICNQPYYFKGSYTDLFVDRSVRTTLSEFDKSGSANNNTYIIGPDVGAAYATYKLFEADIAATIAGPTTGLCDGSKGIAQETESITVAGTTTAADKYIVMKASGTARHAGKYDAAKQYVVVSDDEAINITDDHVRIDGLQLFVAITANNSGYGISVSLIGADNDIRMSNLIIPATAVAGTGSGCGIFINDGDVLASLWNNIIYGFISGVDTGFAAISANVTTANIWNCVVSDNYYGIKRVGGTVNAINCLVFKNTDDFNGTVTPTYCASDDDHTGDSATNFVITQTDDDYAALVVDAAGGDFTPTGAGSQLVGTGTDDPGGATQDDTDIAGNARSSTWDVGAWEYVAAAGDILKQATYYYKMLRAA